MSTGTCRRRRRFVPAALPWMLAGLVVTTAPAVAQTSPTLSADTQFPLSGGQLNLAIAGTPGASFFLKLATAPGELATSWGRVFLDLATLIDVGSGVLDASGAGSVSLPVPPDPTLIGNVFYFQAGTKLGTAKSVTNALAVRVEAAAPSGTRHPAAIAVTPDGARVYVVNETDATVQVVDPASNAIVRDMPFAKRPATMERSPRAAIDPEGRHLFIVDPALTQVTVIHTGSDSIAAAIPVPLACRAVAFRFDALSKRIFVSSEKDQAVLVFTELPDGTFTQSGVLPLRGRGAALLATLPDGHLLVGQHNTLELEIVDPDDGDGDPLVTQIPLGSRALSVSLLGTRAFVTTFTPSTVVGVDGVNELLEFDTTTWTLTARRLGNLGTDYLATAVSSQNLLVTGSGSGSLIVTDPSTFTTTTVVDLVPADPVKGLPRDVALLPPPGGGTPARAYVLDHVRETIVPVNLSAVPPFTLGSEIALAHSGAPRRPLGDLDAPERGEFLFSSVLFFNGSPQVPNPVTCNTCHPNLFSDSITTARVRQCQPLFSIANLAPYGWQGDLADIPAFTQAAFKNHGKVGGKLNNLALSDIDAFQLGITKSPTSPWRNPDGSISPAAQRGQALFNGIAGCSQCHVAPLFIPVAPNPPTIDLGVGTGLAPANVTTLLGLWATAPYLHDGSAKTLLDVLEMNVSDQHGTTSGLDAGQKSDLVEFLKTL
jgi:YVTN family beta-propeller protein